MEGTEDRKGPDERAIRWLVSNMIEDVEMEEFVIAILGSFNAEWGDVWKKASNMIEDENKDGSRNEPVVGHGYECSRCYAAHRSTLSMA